MIHFLRVPEYPVGAISYFFKNWRRYSQLCVTGVNDTGDNYLLLTVIYYCLFDTGDQALYRVFIDFMKQGTNNCGLTTTLAIFITGNNDTDDETVPTCSKSFSFIARVIDIIDQLYLRIPLQIFVKIWNCLNGILRGPGEPGREKKT